MTKSLVMTPSHHPMDPTTKMQAMTKPVQKRDNEHQTQLIQITFSSFGHPIQQQMDTQVGNK